jgi:catechol 2,3-dioxygenase-like lactoylglutathione lyase family enzyme
MDKKKVNSNWILEGTNRKLLISKSSDNRFNFAGFACQDKRSLNLLRNSIMSKEIEIIEDSQSLFEGENFAVLDSDLNKIYFGLADKKKGPKSILHGPLQHITFASKNVQDFVNFYTDILGFKVSDKVIKKGGELSTCFMRSNQEHHTLACFLSDNPGVDHHSYEVGSWEILKDWCDHFSNKKTQLFWGPGRHGPGNNLFAFVEDSDNNKIEISAELEIIHDRSIKVWPHEPRTLNMWGKAFMRS